MNRRTAPTLQPNQDTTSQTDGYSTWRPANVGVTFGVNRTNIVPADGFMTLDSLIAVARQQGASDLHLEAGLPLALRVRGSLRTVGEPVDATRLLAWAREVIGEPQWQNFLERRSADLSRTIQGVRCRINIPHCSPRFKRPSRSLTFIPI